MILSDLELRELVQGELGKFAHAYLGEPTPTDYVVHGRTLLNASRSEDAATITVLETTGQPGGPILWEMPLKADEIFIGDSSIRVFGLAGEPAKTAKIRLPEPIWRNPWGRDPSTLLTGVRAARIGSGLGTPIRIDAAAAHDHHGQWLVENFVEGRPLEPPEVGDFVSDALVPFYRRTAQLRPLGRVTGARHLIGEFEDMAANLPPPSLHDQLPFVLGHGDLALRNVLRTPEGRYAIIDWDHAAIMPAVFDIAEIWDMLDPTRAQEAIATIAGADRAADVIPPATQLALGVLHRSAALRAPGDGFTDLLRTRHGYTRNRARRFKADLDSRIREFILGLSD